MTRAPLVVVLSGPGGAGKGTIARELVARDPRLWLSRSWTSRARRVDDAPDAYRFVTRAEFEAHARAGGFLETNEFRGNLYGTPRPDAPDGYDVLLEIDVNGGDQARRLVARCLLVFVDPPSLEVQRARLRARGDAPADAEARVVEGQRERAQALAMGYHFVVNDRLDEAVAEIAALIAAARIAPHSGPAC